LNLYDEIGYPLAMQIETLQSGAKSNIHNHGTWGIVAILEGQEKIPFGDANRNPIGQIKSSPLLTNS